MNAMPGHFHFGTAVYQSLSHKNGYTQPGFINCALSGEKPGVAAYQYFAS